MAVSSFAGHNISGELSPGCLRADVIEAPDAAAKTHPERAPRPSGTVTVEEQVRLRVYRPSIEEDHILGGIIDDHASGGIHAGNIGRDGDGLPGLGIRVIGVERRAFLV